MYREVNISRIKKQIRALYCRIQTFANIFTQTQSYFLVIQHKPKNLTWYEMSKGASLFLRLVVLG